MAEYSLSSSSSSFPNFGLQRKVYPSLFFSLFVFFPSLLSKCEVIGFVPPTYTFPPFSSFSFFFYSACDFDIASAKERGKVDCRLLGGNDGLVWSNNPFLVNDLWLNFRMLFGRSDRSFSNITWPFFLHALFVQQLLSSFRQWLTLQISGRFISLPMNFD